MFFPKNQRENFSFYSSQFSSLSIPLFHLTRKQRKAIEPQRDTVGEVILAVVAYGVGTALYVSIEEK